MPYSKHHKQQSKERILDSAVDLFCRKGFDNVSIDDLMEEAELTRGAFYAHFSSKGDVYMQSITQASKNTDLIKEIPDGMKSKPLLEYFINGYLSERHVDQEISPCPMAFLVNDVANRDPKVKKTYGNVFEGFVKMIEENLSESKSTNENEQLAYAISALAIGTVAIARSIEDKTLQKRLLMNNKQFAINVIDQ